MIKASLFIISFFIGMACHGQNDTLSPMVLSAAGNSSLVGSFDLSYTVGEPVITTLAYPNPVSPLLYLTQGFHQPIGVNLFNLALSFSSESCQGSNDGTATVQISGGVPPYNVVWSSNPTLNGNTIDSLVPGTYSVTVTDGHGRNKSDIFTILPSENNCLIKIYNGITPNGDGHNDTWVIDNIEEYPDNNVRIFNRWGSIVWSGNSYNNTTVVWMGNNSKGEPLPDGTYFYIVQLSGGALKGYKGWVQLTR